MIHQWMEGNLPVSSKCAVCDKTCGSVLRYILFIIFKVFIMSTQFLFNCNQAPRLEMFMVQSNSTHCMPP